MIKCLILEDEIPAQEVLKNYINRTSFIEYLGVFESGVDIPPALLSDVNLLFLDIQLPDLNGLSYLKTLNKPPKVIVTTAYRDYALDAFEEAVFDYLLKPISYERFLKSVNRLQASLEVVHSPKSTNLFIYADKTTFKISSNDILYIKAEVDYVKIVTKDKNYLVLDSLHNWEEKLSAFSFYRVHRSYLINFDQMEAIRGNQIFIHGEVIPIGKTYRQMVARLVSK